MTIGQELSKLQQEIREEIEQLESELQQEGQGKHQFGVRLSKLRKLTMELSQEEEQYDC